MSKAIRATPILYNREAKEFLIRTESNKSKKVSVKVLKEIKEGASKLQALFVSR